MYVSEADEHDNSDPERRVRGHGPTGTGTQLVFADPQCNKHDSPHEQSDGEADNRGKIRIQEFDDHDGSQQGGRNSRPGSDKQRSRIHSLVLSTF